MALFPRIYNPNSRVPLVGGAPFLEVGNGGKVKTGPNESLGLEWTETYNLDLQKSESINWLAKVEFIFANGQILTDKGYFGTLLGSGGTIKISGSGQTGTSIIMYKSGAPAGNTPLLAGDLIQIGTGSLVHQVGGDTTTDASGGFTASLMPQILSGFTPLNTASVTLTPNVSFSCAITSLQIGEYNPLSKQSTITLKFRQTPV